MIEEAVLNWGLNQGPPALEASTLPLGDRGGGYKHESNGSLLEDESSPLELRWGILWCSYIIKEACYW